MAARRSRWWLAALPSLLAATPCGARPVAITLPAAPLARTLDALARLTGITVGFAGALPAVQTPPVSGTLTAGAALRRLLRGSGLRAVQVDATTYRIERIAPPRPPSRTALPVADRESAPAGDIVVTASKRRELLLDLPLSASVVQPAALPPGQQDSSGLIAASDGAFSTNLGPGRNRLFLRGVADSAFNGPTQSTVGLYLDDARISYATPDPDLKLVDVDRVEVLRGPQGALYGTGSLGGVIRIVANRPRLDDWSGSAAIEGAAIGHGSGGGGGEAVVNVPLVRDRLGLRASGYGERLGGWIDDPGRARRDVNRVDRAGGRVAIRWMPAANWTIDGGITAQWIDAADAQYADGGSGLRRRTAAAQPHDNDFLAAQLGAEGRLGGAALSLATAYVTHEVESVFDAGPRAAGTAPTATVYQENRSMRLFSQEARLSGGSTRAPWLIGLSYLDVLDATTGTFRGGADRVARDQRDGNTELTLFGEASRPIGATTDLRLGLRLFHAREENERRGGAAERSNTRNGVTPSATLSWQPGGNARLWLRYASAIRPGGLDPAPGGRAFASDELQSLEAGWRLALPSANLTWNGAVFGLRWENLQSDVLGDDGLVSTRNIGIAHNVGIESGLQLALGPVRAEGGVTIQHARLQHGAGLDRRLPVIPDVTAHARIAAGMTVGGLDGEAALGARYVGSTRLSFDPRLDRATPAYARLDASLSLGRDRWRGTLAVANLLDSRADTFAFGNPFTVATALQRTPLQPRTVTLHIARGF